MARIQEGNKKFDYIYENIKTMISEVVLDVACVWQQFGPRTVRYYDNAEDGKKVEKFFSMPPDLIRNNLLLNIRAAGQQSNKILDRQNWQSVSVIYQQYITGLIQLAQAAGDKQMEQLIIQYAFAGSTEAMMQILETYDIRNIDRIIPKILLTAARNKTSGLITAGGGGQQPPTGAPPQLPIIGGSPGSGGPPPQPGMAPSAAALATAGNRGTGPTDLVPGAI
jgi:hypothetical protein